MFRSRRSVFALEFMARDTGNLESIRYEESNLPAEQVGWYICKWNSIISFFLRSNMQGRQVQYCYTVMDKSVIPALVDLSINGTEKARASTFELLWQLRDIKYDVEEDCNGSDFDASRDVSYNSMEKKSSSKAFRFFGDEISCVLKVHIFLLHPERRHEGLDLPHFTATC